MPPGMRARMSEDSSRDAGRSTRDMDRGDPRRRRDDGERGFGDRGLGDRDRGFGGRSGGGWRDGGESSPAGNSWRRDDPPRDKTEGKLDFIQFLYCDILL